MLEGECIMYDVRRNEYGNKISNDFMRIEKDAFCKRDDKGNIVYDINGNRVADFHTEYAIHSDDNGFYTYAKVDESDGSVKEIVPATSCYPSSHKYKYKMETKLEEGKIYKRYGPDGQYLTECDSNYDNVSMPYIIDDVEVHYYLVLKRTEQFLCEKGMVAPNFERSGKGIQYYMPNNTVSELLKPGDDGIPYLIDVTEQVFMEELYNGQCKELE